MDIDPDLDNSLRELEYAIRSLGLSVLKINENLISTTSVNKNNASAMANNTGAKNNDGAGKTRYQQILEEENQKNSKLKDSIEKTFGHSVDMLAGFGSALLNTQSGFQKYSNTLENLGKGAVELGSNFGILGKSVGIFVSAFGKLAPQILKLNDNTIGIRDSFAKAGGVIPETTERLGELAKEAKFSLDNIKTLSDKMTEYSSSMISLGTTAGEGALKFMKIVNVEDSVRRQFGRLGVSQDQLLNLQSLYLESQKITGARLLNENKTTEEIQRESLAYAKTLIMLSTLTGTSADELQKEINAVKLEYEEQAQQVAETRQIARLRKEGKDKEADQLEKERNNRLAMIESYTALYDREAAMQMARTYRTGIIDGKNAGLAMLPVEGGITGVMQRVKESDDIVKTLASEARGLDIAMSEQAVIFKDSMQLDPDLMQGVGLFSGAVEKLNRRPDEDIESAIVGALKTMEETMEEGADPQADRYENVRAFERNSKALWQSLLEFIDPMRNFTKIVTTVLGVAAAALTGLVAIKIGKGIVGGLFGGLFDRGASSMNPNHIVLSGMPGLGGGSAAFAGSAADPTGLGLRKADLVDKHGKTLGGAALDARLRKIAEERTPKTTSFALKQAGRNAKAILKGAAALAGAIAIVGAGIAGATWIIGKAIPTFAEGVKKFNEVDGKNLKNVGIGMAGLGAGLYTLVTSQIIGFFTNITSVFGAKSPIESAVDKLKEFAKIDIDADKIERNGKAALIFAKALAKMPATTVTMSGMLAGFFSGPPMPYAEFEKFSKFEVDEANTEKNSKAFISFSKAIASFGGYGTLGSLGAIATALADSVLQHYKIDPPEERLKAFSDLDINPELVGQNALAFKDFAEGMRTYKSPPGILSTISSLIGTKINSIFGPDGPIEAFVQFSKDTKDIGTNAAANARAFFNFARALGMLSRSSGSSGVVSGFFSYIRARGDASDPTLTTPSSTGGSVSSEVDISTAKGEWRKDQAFVKEVERVSSKYGFSPGALIGLMQSESGINPQARNPNGGATGLIQFMPATARSLGTTTDTLYKMTRAQQMAYVDKFFAPYASGLKGASAGKLYAYVFLPGRAGRQSGILTENPEKYYTHNSGLDMNRDGRISISDLDQRVAKKAKEAKVGGLFTGPTSGYPMELHGTELIVPVDSNSILMKLATEATSGKPEGVTDLEKIINPTKQTVSKSSRKNMIDLSRIESISSVLDRIVDVIDSTDDIDQKILRYAD